MSARLAGTVRDGARDCGRARRGAAARAAGRIAEPPDPQDGQELTVLDRKENWLLVAGASRGQGWLKREQVAVLTGE
jgi:hypothetical protein